MDSLKCFESFQSLYWHHLNHQGRQYDPSPSHIHFSVRGGGRGTWVQKLPTQVFNSNLRHFILKSYQTEQIFEMLFYKMERAYMLLGIHSKLQARVKNIANRNLNNIIRLTATTSEIFENVVTVVEYFSPLFHWWDHEDHPCQISGKNLTYRGK